MSGFPKEEKLIRWIVDNIHRAKYNLSLSGLDEPDFASMGVDTSFEHMKKEAPDPEAYFTEILSGLYGYDKGEIFTTTGGSEAIFLISMYAKSREMTVFTGLPEYEPLFNVPYNMGIRTVSRTFRGLQETVSSHEGRKAVFMSNPNNPSGSLHNREYTNGLLESLRSEDLFYTDEAFLEFTFPDRPRSFRDGEENTMINGSLTKFYGFGGMRAGWIVATKEKLKVLDLIRNISGGQNSNYSLFIAGQCLLNRKKFQDRARRIVEPNLALLTKTMNELPVLSWDIPRDAPFALIRYNKDVSSQRICDIALDKYGLFLDPGDYFGEANSFRLCFTRRPESFKESMEVFGRFVQENLL